VFPDSDDIAEVEGEVAAARWTDDFNIYPPGVGFPGPLEHGDSCSLLPGFRAVRDTALRTCMFNSHDAGVGVPSAHGHRYVCCLCRVRAALLWENTSSA
jgi:hypothetical protein